MFLGVNTDDKEGENKNEKHLYFKSRIILKRTFKKHFRVFYALVISLLGRLKQNNCFIALFLG